MSELDALPPDQRAVLQLLLKQGQSYEDLSGLLTIDAAAVRERAHAALAGLAPEGGPRLAPERRAEVSDYLLGQQSVSERASTRDFLSGSASARAWARVVGSSLRPLAGDALPAIPDEAAGAEPAPAAEPAAAARPGGPPSWPLAGPAEPRVSRLGGALLLGGIGILVAVVVVLLVTGGGGGSKSKGDSKGSTLSSTPSTTQTSTASPTPVAQVNLTPPGGGKAVGLAQVFAQGSQRLVIVAGQGLAPGAYALWLYTSPSQDKFLGFVPQRVGKTGRFVTQGVLPADAGSYANLIVTSERVRGNRPALPKRPGAIVLQGKLRLG